MLAYQRRILLGLVTLTGLSSSAQPPATPMPAPLVLPDPGRVTGEWFADNPYAADSSVHAYVIADDTRARVQFAVRGQYNRPWLTTDHRRVVRVLDARGIDAHATVRLRLYSPKGEDVGQSIDDLEAYTHHYAGGRLVSTPVEPDQVHKTRLDEEFTQLSFSFAGVVPGAVLDLSYRIQSGYVSQPPRAYLQDAIPVQAAEYSFRMGQEFGYKATVLGSHPVATDQQTVQGDAGAGSAYGGTARENVFRFALRDAPAITAEAFVTTPNNYRAQALVELERYARPGGQVVEVAVGWDDLSDRLRDSPGLAEALRGAKDKDYLAWAAECPLAADAPPLERADWALRQVASRIALSYSYGVFAEHKLKRMLADGKGDAADRNAALLGLLRALGLAADPLFVSTREHGYLRPELPDMQSLNRLIVALRLGERLHLYDASNSTTGHGVVSVSNLNGEGFLVGDDGHRFVSLQEDAIAQRGLIADLSLGDDGHLAGTFTVHLQDYAALPYTTFGSDGALTIDPADLGELFAGYDLSEVAVEPATGYGYRVLGRLRSRESVVDLGDALALDPNVGTAQARNPLVAERRTYPVEFAHGRVETRQVTLHLPPGHRAEALPEPTATRMPDRGVSYRTGLTQGVDPGDGHAVLTYSTVLAIKKLTYPPEAYESLRQLFDLVAEREGSLVSVVAE